MILAVLDAITFWGLAVCSIALARLAKISLLKAGACVFGIWFAYTGFFVALAMLPKLLMRGT